MPGHEEAVLQHDSADEWTIRDAADTYGIERWGDGYFSISNDGAVLVSPDRDPSKAIDLKRLVDGLLDRGLRLPILLRFNGILQDRLQRLQSCFQQSIDEYGYKNRYRCVFPVKVNQQRDVVQQMVDVGTPLGFGIEAGSKPELLAAIAMTGPGVPIVLNGFKDEEFLRLAMLAERLGKLVIPVIEKCSELDLLLRVASEIGVRPKFGMRVKLATRGTGRWQASGGYRSKFGLTVAEVLAQLDRVAGMGLADCFQLLHFHVGSQIGNIGPLKSALLEASRIYVDLERRGAGLQYLDVGGGLGIDYDGTQTDTDSSMNYSMQEYANDVVFHVQSVCDEAGVPHPELISESGRAIAAQHSVLVVETLGVTRQGTPSGWSATQSLSAEESDAPFSHRKIDRPPEHYEKPVHHLWEACHELTPDNARESFHDAQVALDLCMNLFSGGYLPLEQRVAAENLYFTLCHRIRDIALQQSTMPEELEKLQRMLSDIYFVNFSIFQSMPDAWAIDQLFPIMPIHRLDERPTRRAVLGDITCDSDGKVDSFVTGQGRQQTLPLHPLRGDQPYQLAVFLVGAYQEILGDLHNLFGDTHAVHVDGDGNNVKVKSIVKGDTVSKVLGYVQYDDRDLMRRIQDAVEDAINNQTIDAQQAGKTIQEFERALSGYTYLSRPTVLPHPPASAGNQEERTKGPGDSTVASQSGEDHEGYPARIDARDNLSPPRSSDSIRTN